MTLKNLFENSKFKSDKGTTHDYINGYYDFEFTPKGKQELNLLEIGVHAGLSIKLWKDWFVNSKITGIDPCQEAKIVEEILNEVVNSKNVNIIENDAYTQNTLNMFADNTFDYIIDDGPHTLQSQLYSINNWLKKVKVGGKLIIEDIQSISYLNELVLAADGTGMKWEVFDLRQNKGRYDDIILEITVK